MPHKELEKAFYVAVVLFVSAARYDDIAFKIRIGDF